MLWRFYSGVMMMGVILWACLVISHNESSPSSAHRHSHTIDLINLSIFHNGV